MGQPQPYQTGADAYFSKRAVVSPEYRQALQDARVQAGADPRVTPYFAVFTLQYHGQLATANFTLNVSATDNRYDVFLTGRILAARAVSFPENAAVVFYSIEPMELRVA